MPKKFDQTLPGGRERKKDGTIPDGLVITVEVIEGPDEGLRHQVRGSRTVFGRKDAEVELSDPTVSGRHAMLEMVGGKLFLTDLGSTNGTTLNGDRIESAPVQNLDQLGLGDTRILLTVVEDKYGAYLAAEVPADEDLDDSRVEDTEATVIEEALPNPDLDSTIKVMLDVVAGPDQGKKFQVARRSTVIGRSEKADLRLSDTGVSQRHCQIEIHNKDKMTIKDLASSNGTRLNDHYVSAVKIRHGDLVQIGETIIKILIHIRR
jgi:pSer/pThr/pTyr-binding forkhead associated (FHA) protein